MSYKYTYKVQLTHPGFEQYYYFGKHTTDELNDGYKGSGTKLLDYYKYFPNDYKIEILDFYDTDEELNKAEFELIKPHLVDENCLNLRAGGNGIGWKQEVLDKISNTLKSKYESGELINPMTGKKLKDLMTDEAYNEMLSKHPTWATTTKGKKKTEEQKRKQSETMKEYYKTHDVWNKGKQGVYSEESLKKMSESSKGFKHTEESKNKISESLKGKCHLNSMTEEQIQQWKQNISKSLKGRKSYVRTEEHKERMRQILKGKNTKQMHKNKIENTEDNLLY